MVDGEGEGEGEKEVVGGSGKEKRGERQKRNEANDKIKDTINNVFFFGD